MSDVTLQRADDESVRYVERLLARNDLPTEGVRANPERFYVARNSDRSIGVGGLEIYGDVALLRSVAVDQSLRGEGFGSALCDKLERRASDAGVETVYLLTTTAVDFFEGRGYEETDREYVPDEIRETAEFSAVCPSTATCLSRSL